MTTERSDTSASQAPAEVGIRYRHPAITLWRPLAVLVIILGSGLDIGSSPAADVTRLLGFIVVLIITGDTLLRALRFSLNALQALTLSAVGGVAIVTLLSAWLSLIEPTNFKLLVILAVTVTTGALALTPGARTHRFERSGNIDWTLAAVITATPALLYGAIARSPFYLGYDPFTMAAYAQKLVDQPVSPLDFSSAWFNHAGQVGAGAYYFTAGAGVLSSHTVAGIVRVGGPALLGLTALLLFLLIRQAFDTRLGAAVGAVLFVSSPFVMSRYVMYIRENLALIFFLALVLILVRPRSPLRVGTVVFASLLTGLSLQTHEFVAVLAIATWGVFFAVDLFTPGRREGWSREMLAVGSLTAVFALPFAIPVLAQFAPLFISSQAAGIAGSLSPDDKANYIWRRGIEWSDFNWIGFLLAAAGVATLIKPDMRRNALIIFAPILGLATAIALFAAAGAPLPTVRLILYLALALAVVGGLGAAVLARLAWDARLRVTTIVALALILTISVVPIATYRKGTPFSAGQVHGARDLATASSDSGLVILTPFNEVALLLFADVDGVVTDRTLVNDVMTAESRESLLTALTVAGLDTETVYLYADKRVVRDGVDVSPDALGGSSRDFTVFTFLRESNPELPLGSEPSRTWPSGPCVEWTDLGHAWLIRVDRC